MLVAGLLQPNPPTSRSEARTSWLYLMPPAGSRRAFPVKFGDFDLASIRTKLYEGASAVGDDGFVYLLRSDEVIVISSPGRWCRRMRFKNPDPSLLATRVDESGGTVLVQLDRDNGNRQAFHDAISALDASTGKRRGFYAPEPALGNSLVCFTRNEGLTFLPSRKRNKSW